MADDRDSLVPIREYLDARVSGMCEKHDRYCAAHRREHELEARAVESAADNLSFRLKILNEWKDKSADDKVTYLSIEKHDGDMRLVTAKLDGFNARVWILLVAVIMLLGGVIFDLITR